MNKVTENAIAICNQVQNMLKSINNHNAGVEYEFLIKYKFLLEKELKSLTNNINLAIMTKLNRGGEAIYSDTESGEDSKESSKEESNT